MLCELGTMTVGSEEVIKVRVRAKGHGKKVNAGKVTSDTYEPDPNNNSLTATAKVLRARKQHGHHLK